MKHIATILFAFAWILIPAALMYAGLVVGELYEWQRTADKGVGRITR